MICLSQSQRLFRPARRHASCGPQDALLVVESSVQVEALESLIAIQSALGQGTIVRTRAHA